MNSIEQRQYSSRAVRRCKRHKRGDIVRSHLVIPAGYSVRGPVDFQEAFYRSSAPRRSLPFSFLFGWAFRKQAARSGVRL